MSGGGFKDGFAWFLMAIKSKSSWSVPSSFLQRASHRLTATRRKLRGLRDLSAGSVTPAAIAFPPILIALRFNASFPFMPVVEDDLAAKSSDSDRVKEGCCCGGKRCALAGSLSAERDFLALGNEAGTSRLAMVVDGSRGVGVLQ